MSRSLIVSAVLIALGAVAHVLAADPEPAAPQREERDENGNGQVDRHVETRQLAVELTLKTMDSIDEGSGDIKGRVSVLEFQGRPFWTETVNFALKDRFTQIEAEAPYDIACAAMGGVVDANIVLFDRQGNMVASLVRDKVGRLEPAPDEILKQGQSVADAVIDAIRRAEQNSPEAGAADPADGVRN